MEDDLGYEPLDDAGSAEETELLDELAELVAHIGCLSCRHPFDQDEVRLLARYGDAWLMSGYCESCDMHQLVVILVHEVEREPNASAVGEMTWQEWEEASQRDPISVEDVRRVDRLLAVHSDLKQLL
ncbi:MAG: hypothetical protein GX605_14270 [Chloroflexi bacterium]|nr:hypothetical protein [Chloroflexota bacterium]